MKKKNFKFLFLVILLSSTAVFILGLSRISPNIKNANKGHKKALTEVDNNQKRLTSAWISDGTPICTETNIQLISAMCSDGSGGAFLVWYDNRTGSQFYTDMYYPGIYAQHISSSGKTLWNPNGIQICTNTSSPIYFDAPFGIQEIAICNADDGGVIIAWNDQRDGDLDIYAQKISASGTLLWASGGVLVCSDDSDQLYPTIISDQQNGAIIVWNDYRNGNSDIYAT